VNEAVSQGGDRIQFPFLRFMTKRIQRVYCNPNLGSHPLKPIKLEIKEIKANVFTLEFPVWSVIGPP
jgi:hypothetical protein